MKLSFKYYPSLTTDQVEIINELSYHTSKLYNIGNYENREVKYQSYFSMEQHLKSNWHKNYLHSHVYQQCLKVLEQDWKSFFKASSDYKSNPSKYLGKPKPPRYKNASNPNSIIFTNYAIRITKDTLKLSLSKKMQEKFDVKSLNLILPTKVLEQINLSTLQQIRINWDIVSSRWYLILIYIREERSLGSDYTNVMAIDLGLDNLCAITFKDSLDQYLISGKYIKSKNSYYNQEISRLTSIEMKSRGSSNFKRTKRIKSINRNRANFIKDYLHKTSRKVISLAMAHKCSSIAIGDIKGIKQGNNIKGFVSIPIMRLVELIKYKANLMGITTIMIKEHYTSVASAYDLETIDLNIYDKNRRIKRGLFKTNTGLLVSSDINGSLNILRRHLKDVVPRPIEELRDNGCLNHPVRLQIA